MTAHFAVTTFRQDPLSGLASESPGRGDREPGGFGLTLDDAQGFLRTEQVTLGQREAVIGRLQSTGYKGRFREDANFTFVLQHVGRYDVEISGREYSMLPGDLLAFRPNERRTQVSPGRSGTRVAMTLQLPVARMSDIARAMETTPDAVFPRDGFALRGDGGLTLARVLPTFAEDLIRPSSAPLPPRLASEVQRLIDELLCEMIGRTVEQPASRRIFPAYHRVRLAEDMIRAQSDDAVSMLSVAEALGVSLRSLQLAFREVHDGMNPREFLIRVRLEKARARLLVGQGDAKVTTVAMDCGFFHLGRFSQAYARMFRELPSETLARRRA